MRGLSERLDSALAAIDAANAEDPNRVVVRGEDLPLAVAHGRLAAEWVARLVPDADDALVLAARAHHLRRWVVPRASYPAGRAGYLRWRRDQKDRHAREIVPILLGAGYDEATVNRVQVLLRRVRIDEGSGTQTIEDAACLAFLETQLADVVERLDRDTLRGVLRRTADKMSTDALALVAEIPLDDTGRAALDDALG